MERDPQMFSRCLLECVLEENNFILFGAQFSPVSHITEENKQMESESIFSIVYNFI